MERERRKRETVRFTLSDPIPKVRGARRCGRPAQETAVRSCGKAKRYIERRDKVGEIVQ